MQCDFKDRLVILRKENNFTQDKLADELNVSKSTISMYEKGNRMPSYEMLEKIADFFNVDIDYLMGKSDIKRKVSVTPHSIISNIKERELTHKELLKVQEKESISLISIYLEKNSACSLGEIKRGNKVDVIKNGEILKTYDVELILKAYEIKYLKDKFSLEDIEELENRFSIPEDLKGISRKQYIKFMGESAMFFDDDSISEETKDKLLLSFQRMFYDAKEKNRRKK
mgnify:CR=1 FL=1